MKNLYQKGTPYGYWITPQGKIIEVEYCGHTKACPYNDADSEGWICVIDILDDRESMSIRTNPETVTKGALRKMVAQVRKSEKTRFYMSDIFTRSFVGYPNQGPIDRAGMNKQDAIEFLYKLRENPELEINHYG